MEGGESSANKFYPLFKVLGFFSRLFQLFSPIATAIIIIFILLIIIYIYYIYKE